MHGCMGQREWGRGEEWEGEMEQKWVEGRTERAGKQQKGLKTKKTVMGN